MTQNKPTDISDNDARVVRVKAAREWPDDFAMRLHTEQEQFEAIRALRRERPADIPPDTFQIVRSKAAREWPDDFVMRLYTEEEQFEAIRALYQGSPEDRHIAMPTDTGKGPHHGQPPMARKLPVAGTSQAIREFLAAFQPDELARLGILQPQRRVGHLLQGVSVGPLLDLMQRRGVTGLIHPGGWELLADGRCRNAWAGRRDLVHYSELDKPGDVFRNANPHINPFFGPSLPNPVLPSPRSLVSSGDSTQAPPVVPQAEKPATVVNESPSLDRPPDASQITLVGRVTMAPVAPAPLRHPIRTASRADYLTRQHARPIAAAMGTVAALMLIASATTPSVLLAVALLGGSVALLVRGRRADNLVDPAIEGPLLELAARSHGRLTVAQVALGLGVSLADANRALTALARTDYANIENTPAGHVEYVFPEFVEGPNGGSRES